MGFNGTTRAMYNVSEMRSELANAVVVAEDKIVAQFVTAFEAIYDGNVVPERFSNAYPRIDQVTLAELGHLERVYSGEGFYVILSDRIVDGNACRLTHGKLRAIYRGECGTVRKRIQSHLFNSRYNTDFEERSARYRADPKNQGKSFYEAHWPHCLKLDVGGPSGVNIDQQPHSNYQWLVLVHRMNGSSQRVRQLAEMAFDVAFGHPEGSRDI